MKNRWPCWSKHRIARGATIHCFSRMGVIAILLPAAQEYRHAAPALVARAMLRLNDGKVDEAWGDLLACHRLARLVGQGPTAVEALVAVTVDAIAFTGDQGLLQHAKLTAAQAQRMRNDLAELPPMPGMANRINLNERFIYLDSVLTVPRDRHFSLTANLKSIEMFGGETTGMVQPFLDNLGNTEIDWDVVLRTGNTWYDRVVAAWRESNHSERRKAIGEIKNDMNNMAAARRTRRRCAAMAGDPRKAISEQLGKIFVVEFLPAVFTPAAAADRNAMQFELTKLAFAMAQYRADHDSYPEKLADLVPKYVTEVPQDIFNDSDLHYTREDDGYLLYSVGSNGRDDGGKGYDDRTGGEDWDDLAVRVPAKS